MWGFVRAALLPSLPPPVVGSEAEAMFATAADQLLGARPPTFPSRGWTFAVG